MVIIAITFQKAFLIHIYIFTARRRGCHVVDLKVPIILPRRHFSRDSPSSRTLLTGRLHR